LIQSLIYIIGALKTPKPGRNLRQNPPKKKLFSPGDAFSTKSWAYCSCKRERGGGMIMCNAKPRCPNGYWFHYEQTNNSPTKPCVIVTDLTITAKKIWLCPWCRENGKLFRLIFLCRINDINVIDFL
jgi:hypothetical protein